MLNKTQSRWVYAFSLVSVVSFLGMVTFSHKDEQIYMLLAYLAGVSGVISSFLLVESVTHASARQLLEGNEAIKNIKSTFLSQEYVDKSLHNFASDFDAVCRIQISLSGGENGESQLKDASQLVAAAKTTFCEAYHLAKKLGFRVGNRVSDYYTYPPRFTEPVNG